MTRLRRTIQSWLMVLALSAILAVQAMAGQSEDGYAAYMRRDYPTALLLLRPLADRGDYVAQSYLGLMYEHGFGVPADQAEAANRYHDAAEHGVVIAQVNLGTMYANGRGVPKDDAEAVKWFRSAAALGSAFAEVKLGLAFSAGHGVPKDPVESLKWFQRAANHGSADAQSLLAQMYFDGDGVPQDFAEAYKWANLAAAVPIQAWAAQDSWGRSNAITLRDQALTKMSPAQIAQAQELARQPHATTTNQTPPGVNMFDDIDPTMGAEPKRPPGDDPFADIVSRYPPGPAPQTGAFGTFVAHSARGVLPATAGWAAGAVAGAKAGAAISGFGGPGDAAVGGLVVGLVGFFGGAALVNGTQDWALHQMPDSWQETIGQSDRLRRVQEIQHPVAVFWGCSAPYAAAMSLLIWWSWRRRNVMILDSNQTQIGEGGAKSGPGVEKELPQSPHVNRRLQIALTIVIVLLSGGMEVYRTLNPQSDDRQARLDLYYHPVASVAGSLVPTVIFAPVAYWIFGRISRRIAARYAAQYKVCQFCAETIKSQAKVCRYCGREVTPSASDTT